MKVWLYFRERLQDFFISKEEFNNEAEIKQAIKEYGREVLSTFVAELLKEKRMLIDSEHNFYYGVSEENVNKLLEKSLKMIK